MVDDVIVGFSEAVKDSSVRESSHFDNFADAEGVRGLEAAAAHDEAGITGKITACETPNFPAMKRDIPRIGH